MVNKKRFNMFWEFVLILFIISPNLFVRIGNIDSCVQEYSKKIVRGGYKMDVKK